MAKPQVYINLAQCLAIAGATVLGIHYLEIQRNATGIQKVRYRENIMNDAKKLVGVFTTPFRNYF